MAAFAEFYRHRNSIADKYFAMIEEAQKHRESEFMAAIRIQMAWKAHVRRQKLAKRNKMATIIQRNFRMHQAHILVQCLRVEKAKTERIAYFNAQATKIQKCWRGFDSRRHVFDYHKQQRYLKQVADANEQMRRELDDHYAETNENERREVFKKSKRIQKRNALKQHHLVSTAAIPSIFQPPAFTKDAEAMPAIENFIRNVNKAKLVIPSLGNR
ncbi:IQ calmodulin-binding motif family protein [Tritrichomonas foetus]|uniref:IQ calmodulin-binding motif family protein n=1 Tax=Tritrichomonas foetus TaxID=1144522 RepID=A0A1J4JDC2_9EUKA|nr:IQ calmodulin-binding motif family protein [Tritrichomonas foetus]|eukprot:OHS96279.1 IQ calmodulin-binding motif family protein [Tritrichomonas foetus]